MAKIQGLTGKMSGKMGSVVFRVRQGEQIVTQYNPIVKNPNTEAQSTQRVAFKLMSQVAAAMASAIINRPARQGQSARNRFVQQNFPLVETDGSNAKIALARLQLTSSTSYLGSLNQSGQTGSIVNIPANVTKVRVVTVTYPRAGTEFKPVVSEIQNLTVTNGSVTFGVEEGMTYLAYGLIPTTGAAKVALDNMAVNPTEPFIAHVNLERLVSSGAVNVTETLGINVSAS